MTPDRQIGGLVHCCLQGWVRLNTTVQY